MNASQLRACTGCFSLDRSLAWLPSIVDAMSIYGIDTPKRQAYFLAQIGHESGGLKFTSELWGPTIVQQRYEGRDDLGNTQPGDGSKFRGHGLIQVTGRANHARARDRIRLKYPDCPDFEREPEKLAMAPWAALSAADFWQDHDLNTWADMDSVDGVSDIINRGHKTRAEGDTNGFAQRAELTRAALEALGC